ncbi:MAG: SDR family oxidoreductase [Planctomycetaceae bacterium]|nr:SDR family oxidoreductase [Planctomycetales bacterium]MCB9927732.1 SDR family oxidoreductase [Planctomycetaceae bacterium]
MQAIDLSESVALVTGASLGIGRAIAIALGRAGASVVVNFRSHESQADEVVAAVKNTGARAIKCQADVSDLTAVEAMVSRTVEELGRLDIAIANAAFSDRELFFEADMEGFRRTVDVTMWGTFNLLRAASRQMIRQGEGGAIVLVSSPHAFVPVPRSMAYNLSKAAVEHMSRTAAIELAEHRIRVNTLQPGWTDTPGERKFASDETIDAAAKNLPFGRLGTPEEMAEAVLFMCNPQNSYMTGASLLIDGGITLPWWTKRGPTAAE